MSEDTGFLVDAKGFETFYAPRKNGPVPRHVVSVISLDDNLTRYYILNINSFNDGRLDVS